ncbi:MAG: hypothetical protein ACP5LW_01705 [Nitrososphaeria archaeon]
MNHAELILTCSLVSGALFVPGAVEDFRYREVHDHFLILPYASYFALYLISGLFALELSLLLAFVFFVILLIINRKGYVAIGDVLGMPSIFSIFYAVPFLILFFPLTALIDLTAYYYRNRDNGGGRRENNEKFVIKHQKNGRYEYGVPLVGYAYTAVFLSSLAYATLLIIRLLSY